MAVRWFLTSRGSEWLFRVLSSPSRSLLHRSFHRRKAHSDAAMRRKRVAPGLGVPSGDLILRGRAIIEDMLKPCGHLMCFIVYSSLTIFQAWSQPLASQLKIMCCIDSVVLQFWQFHDFCSFFILSQYWLHLCALWTSFQRKERTLVDRSQRILLMASHILLSEGHEPSS